MSWTLIIYLIICTFPHLLHDKFRYVENSAYIDSHFFGLDDIQQAIPLNYCCSCNTKSTPRTWPSIKRTGQDDQGEQNKGSNASLTQIQIWFNEIGWIERTINTKNLFGLWQTYRIYSFCWKGKGMMYCLTSYLFLLPGLMDHPSFLLSFSFYHVSRCNLWLWACPRWLKRSTFFFQLCFLLHSFVFFWGFHYDMQKFWFMCFVYLLTGYYYSVCPCEIGRLQGCSSSQILVKFYICHFYAQGCILLQLKRLCWPLLLNFP